MSDQYVDQTIQCKDCPESFVFSAGEQTFYAEKIGPGFVAPKRCKECRAKHKAQKQGGAPYASAPTGTSNVTAEAEMGDGRRPQGGPRKSGGNRSDDRRGGRRDSYDD